MRRNEISPAIRRRRTKSLTSGAQWPVTDASVSISADDSDRRPRDTARAKNISRHGNILYHTVRITRTFLPPPPVRSFARNAVTSALLLFDCLVVLRPYPTPPPPNKVIIVLLFCPSRDVRYRKCMIPINGVL